MVVPSIVAGVVVLLAGLHVAWPLLRDPDPRVEASAVAGKLALVEERDRALAALKELEFDHRTGRVSDSDYRELVGALRKHAAETLRALQTGEESARSEATKRSRAAVSR